MSVRARPCLRRRVRAPALGASSAGREAPAGSGGGMRNAPLCFIARSRGPQGPRAGCRACSKALTPVAARDGACLLASALVRWAAGVRGCVLHPQPGAPTAPRSPLRARSPACGKPLLHLRRRASLGALGTSSLEVGGGQGRDRGTTSRAAVSQGCKPQAGRGPIWRMTSMGLVWPRPLASKEQDSLLAAAWSYAARVGRPGGSHLSPPCRCARAAHSGAPGMQSLSLHARRRFRQSPSATPLVCRRLASIDGQPCAAAPPAGAAARPLAPWAGLMWQNAADFGAILLWAEHRYYGKSEPFGERPHLVLIALCKADARRGKRARPASACRLPFSSRPVAAGAMYGSSPANPAASHRDARRLDAHPGGASTP